MSLPVSYTNASEMLKTLAEIGSISTINNSLMLHHAGRAEALINAKIAKRYSIPIAGQIPLLETLATDLAIYNLLCSRIVIKEEHPWFQRYKGAMVILDEIADGKLSLIDNTGEIQVGRTDVAECWSSSQGHVPTFWEGPDTLQIQDEEKIDDQATDRDLTTLGGQLQ